jgi:2-iminobutanoate/2-iminopropanoate deaminase
MARSNRRSFLATAPAVAIAAGTATAALAADKKDKAAAEKVAAEKAATDKAAAERPVKKVLWSGGKAPEKQALFSPVVTYGNLVFLSGIGYHKEGDIKVHTAGVLDEMQRKLEEAGSSMQKVLKVNVYLNDLKDYAAMNEVFLGRFGPEPGVRTTVAPAGGIPGNSLVEIDCIACI